ncbi:MAG: fimbrillin family protein [Bacteroides sp.]|nr:fimbrillin family protein [Bacteroides sp.]
MNRRSLLLFLSLPLLTACGDDAVPSDSRYSDVLRVLSVGTGETVSRSVVTNTELAAVGAQIGVYAVNSDGTQYEPLFGGGNTAVYEYTGSVWNVSATEDSKLLRLPSATGATVSTYAYYLSTLVPEYKTSGGSSVSGVEILTKDDFEASAQTDYLYSDVVADVNAATAGVKFTMRHALAKLTFRVYKTASLTETMKLTALQLIDNSNNLQGGTGKSMRLKDGQLQGLTGQSSITLTATDAQKREILQKASGAAGDTNTATAYCLVAPAPNVEYLSVQLTTATGDAGTEQTFLTSRTYMKTDQWSAGQHLIVTLLLDGMKATISSIKVYQWEDYTDTYLPIS